MHGRTEQHTVAQAPVLARAHSALSSTPTTFDPTAKYKNRLELCPLICSAPRPTPVQPATNHGSRLRCVIAVATALFHLLATEMPMRRQVAASGTTTSKLALPPAGHHQRLITKTRPPRPGSGCHSIVAAHHLPAASWAHRRLPWIGSSGTGAGELGLGGNGKPVVRERQRSSDE